MSTLLHIIYNPNAAGGRSRKLIEVAVPFLHEGGKKTILHVTQYAGHATQIAAELSSQDELIIIAAGGDGTVSEVVNGIMQNPQQETIRLGVLPLGTGDDFVKDFHIRSLEEGVQRILKNECQKIDIGKLTILEPCNDSPIYFINMFGLGVIARGAKLRRDVYAWAGKMGYHLAFFHMLPTLKSYPITMTVGDESPFTIHSQVMCICNSQYSGHGMRLSPQSNTGDGLLEFLYAEQLSAWEMLMLFSLLPTGKHVSHPKIAQFQSKTFEISLNEIQDFMLDGEVKSGKVFRIEVLHKSVWMIV